ncbi:MAG: Nif3-like dinuclear metal center hexameric protein, partial [Rhodoluna sp.]
MSIQLSDLLNVCESLWPLDGAEEWDAPGLVTGKKTQSVSRVLLTVDVTNEIIDEAIDGEFDVVIAHHPFLLRSVNTVAEDAPKGLALSKAIRSNLAIYAAHTNADVVENGVSDVLAKALGLIESKPLLGEVIGTGRVGNLPSEIKLGDFARLIAKVLPSTATGIRVAGDYEKSICR